MGYAESKDWHSLVILNHLETTKKRQKKDKWYIVVSKCGVVPAIWDGEKFLGVDGVVIENVEYWGNYPTHPDLMKDKRW